MNKTLQEQDLNNIFYQQVNPYRSNRSIDNNRRQKRADYCTDVAKRYALGQQIKENQSILQMLESYSDERCSTVVKHRIFTLEKQLEELNNGTE